MLSIIQIEVDIGSKPLHILLEENNGLELNHGVLEWVYPDGTKTVQPLFSILKRMKNSSSELDFDHCFYKGNVNGERGSIGR